MLLSPRIVSISLLIALAQTVSTGDKSKRTIRPPDSPSVFTIHKLPKYFPGDPVVTSDTPSCVIPFNRVGNLIVIKAKADSVEGNFILDTGAPGLILNMTYFRNYSASSDPETESGGVTGATTASSPTVINKFSMGPVKYFRAEADRINLGHIENSKGIKILGLMGMQLFKRFEMIIDYENNLLYLHLINKKEAASYKSQMLKDTSAYNTFDINILEDKLLTYGEMGGKKLMFVIDSGAESNILDSRLPGKIFENVSITGRVILAGTGNRKVEALYGDVSNMKIGGRNMGTLPVLVTNLEKMCFSYNQCIDGMLGFDFLSLHKIGFNFVNRKMYIWK